MGVLRKGAIRTLVFVLLCPKCVNFLFTGEVNLLLENNLMHPFKYFTPNKSIIIINIINITIININITTSTSITTNTHNQLGHYHRHHHQSLPLLRFLLIISYSLYGCESWTIKKAERQRIDAFEVWCWRRLLRVPCTARTSNQSILKEISPGCSLEGLMVKLKLQYFGHLMRRADSFEKTLMLGKIEGRRRRG